MADKGIDEQILDAEIARAEHEKMRQEAMNEPGLEADAIYKPAELAAKALGYGSGLMRYPVTQALTGVGALTGKEGVFKPGEDLMRTLKGEGPTITEAAVRAGAPNNSWVKALGLVSDLGLASPAMAESSLASRGIAIPSKTIQVAGKSIDLNKLRYLADPIGYAGMNGPELAAPVASHVGSFLNPGVTTKEAYNYIKNPDLSKKLFEMARHDRGALDEAVLSKVQPALSGENSIYNKVSKPLLDDKAAMLQGKDVTIDTNQLKSQLARKKLMDSLPQKYGQSMQYSEPQIQNVHTPNGYEPIEVPISTVEKQSVPIDKELPESMTIPASEADKIRAASGEAAKFIKGQTSPTAKNSNNAKDAFYLKNQVNAVDEDLPQLNREIQRHIKMQDRLQKIGQDNPSRLLVDSEALGNKGRAMRQYLDKNTGTDLETMANSYQAGRAMHGDPITLRDLHGAFGLGPVSAPAGTGLIHAASYYNKAVKSPGVAPFATRLLYDQAAKVLNPTVNPWTLLPTAEDDKK